MAVDRSSDRVSRYKKAKPLIIQSTECTARSEVHLNSTPLIVREKTPTKGKNPKNCAKANTAMRIVVVR